MERNRMERRVSSKGVRPISGPEAALIQATNGNLSPGLLAVWNWFGTHVIWQVSRFVDKPG